MAFNLFGGGQEQVSDDGIERFREAMGPGRCPLCFLAGIEDAEYIRSVLAESATDPDTRMGLDKTDGFCRRHAWKAVEQGEALGLGVIYEWFLERLASDKVPLSGRSFDTCPVCKYEDGVVKVYAKRFAAWYGRNDEFRTAYHAHDGLCLPHIRQVLVTKMSADLKGKLEEHFRGAAERRRVPVGKFLEGQRHGSGVKPTAEEEVSWKQAVKWYVGDRP